MKTSQIIEQPNIPFVDMIKKQLLSYDIKTECCKNSFACGISVFERSRKNKYSEQIEEYLKKQKSRKKKQFFEELTPKGFQMNLENGDKYPEAKMPCPHCEAHLLRGAFLVCGRASKTEKGVAFEMVMPSEKAYKVVSEALGKIDLEFKKTVRKGEHLIYSRKAQEIEDFLSYIGALNASFYVMNSIIEKELIMKVSRITNCDANNLIKMAQASARQNEAIKAIIRNDAMKLLSPTLRNTAELRLSYPEESLEKLTELHGGNITKSGVNHRLQKIVSFAVKNGYIK